MTPSELSARLLHIASAIDASRNPDRNAVLRDLRRVVASFNGRVASEFRPSKDLLRAVIGEIALPEGSSFETHDLSLIPEIAAMAHHPIMTSNDADKMVEKLSLCKGPSCQTLISEIEAWAASSV